MVCLSPVTFIPRVFDILFQSSGAFFPPLRSPRSSSRRLAAFLRLRGLKVVDDGTFSLISAAWRDSTNDQYERAWVKFEEFLLARGLPLDPITVKSGMAYLTFLYHRGLQWRTIGISRSAISQTLPKWLVSSLGMTPIEVPRLITD